MKIIVLNEDIGLSTTEPFEVKDTKSFYVIDHNGSDVMVDADDCEVLENPVDEDEDAWT